MSAVLDLLLSRLEGVKRNGKNWRCECPIGHKSKGTLVINADEDGTVLIRCHAGCVTLDVLHRIGMDFSDLFEKPIKASMSPAQRRELRQAAKQSHWTAALDVLEREGRVIQIAGQQIAAGIPLDDVDDKRLNEAIDRVESARLVLRG